MNRITWDSSIDTNRYSDGMQCPESQVVGNYTLVRDTDDPEDVVRIENSAYELFIEGEYNRLKG